jgi:hypothetical protein
MLHLFRHAAAAASSTRRRVLARDAVERAHRGIHWAMPSCCSRDATVMSCMMAAASCTERHDLAHGLAGRADELVALPDLLAPNPRSAP